MRITNQGQKLRLDLLDETQRSKIEEYFRMGHGPNAIAILLQIPSRLTTRYLVHKGLRRTREESYKAKMEAAK